jgi:hypothetical protein
MKYTIIELENRQPVIQAEDKDGNILFIPCDPANSDYQAYLESLNEVKPDADKL